VCKAAALLAGNALEESIGHEMALSMDARCSRIMEKLLKYASDNDLVRYLEGITKVGPCRLTSGLTPGWSRLLVDLSDLAALETKI